MFTFFFFLLTEDDWKKEYVPVPIPVPVYVPVPMNMYSQNVPVPTTVPVPVSESSASFLTWRPFTCMCECQPLRVVDCSHSGPSKGLQDAAALFTEKALES